MPNITEKATHLSPKSRARIAGLFYLCVVGAPIALFKGQSLFVPGDAAATAQNILSQESSFRMAIVAAVAAYAAYMVVAVLLYDLFRPVNRTLSLVAAVFCLAGSLIAIIASSFQIAPFVILAGGAGASAPAAYMSLSMYAQGFTLSMVFFGLYMLLIGYLVAGSGFMPRVIGVLTIMTGIAYLTHSLAFFVSPPFASSISSFVYLFGVGELTLVLWLLVGGVEDSKWREQSAGAARMRDQSLKAKMKIS